MFQNTTTSNNLDSMKPITIIMLTPQAVFCSQKLYDHKYLFYSQEIYFASAYITDYPMTLHILKTTQQATKEFPTCGITCLSEFWSRAAERGRVVDVLPNSICITSLLVASTKMAGKTFVSGSIYNNKNRYTYHSETT